MSADMGRLRIEIIREIETLKADMKRASLPMNRGEKVERLRGHAGVAQRKRRLLRTNGLCERCLPKRVSLATVVDHIKPLALGGSDEDSNTRNLCHECHEAVTAEQFGYRKRQRIAVDGWPIED